MNQLHARGILSAKPQTAEAHSPPAPGEHRLVSPAKRAASLLYLPNSYRPDLPAALLLLLHGAGGLGDGMLEIFRPYAESTGTVLLAPTSNAASWDLIAGGYGADVAHIDAALKRTFADIAIDPGHLAIGGFSDGASYALSLGVANGGLFSHILAFSPGFQAATRHHGKPRIFIAHGTGDRVLPIDHCSRRLLPGLHSRDYDLSYHEFDGGHELLPEFIERAFRWFLA